MLNFIKKILGIKPPDYQALLKEEALIIDVRTAKEFASGHVKGSTNIPLNQIGDHVSKIQKTGKPVITFCKSGGRSAMANRILKRSGIRAYNAGSWQNMQSIIDHSK